MKKLIERLRQYSESLVAYKLGADFADAVCSAADMLENHASDRAALVAEIEKLRKQLKQTQAERDALAERNRSAYEIAWGCDIPSPTVPEYVELHEGMTRVMEALKGPQKEA